MVNNIITGFFTEKIFSIDFYMRLIIFSFIFLIYLMSGHDVTVSNDQITNIQQIEAYDFYSRSSHFSLHFFGIIFYWLLNTFLGMSVTGSIQFMLSFFSAISATLLYALVIDVFKNKRLAFITVFIYAFSTNVWRMSIQSEYLILVPSFGIIALYFFIKDKYILSGLAFGFGVLVSAFMICFLPAFLLKLPSREKIIKSSAFFVAGIVSIWGIVNVFTFQETVSGSWSYGGILSYYYENLKYVRSFLILMYGYIRSFNLVMIITIIGLILLLKENKKLFYLTIGLLLLHIPTIFNEARLGAYQIPVYPFVAISAAYFIDKFWKRRKFFFIFMLMIFFSVNAYLVFAEREFSNNLANTYVKLQSDENIPDSSIIFMYHASRAISEVYAPRLLPISIVHEYHFDKIKDMDPEFNFPNYAELINSEKEKFILESGTLPPDDQIKNYFLSFMDKEGVKTKGFALRTLNPFLENRQLKLLPDYPMDVYKIANRESR